MRLAAGSCAKPVTSSLWRCISIPSCSHPPKHLTGLYALSGSKRPLATRLTQRTKREVKASDVPEVKHTRPEHVCRGCGKTIRRGGTSCADCAIEGATQRLEAAARIGRSVSHTPDPELSKATRRRHARACSDWDPSTQRVWLTENVFLQKVLPLLAGLSTSSIAAAIGVSRGYAGRIREGDRPHPRHWQALGELVGISAGE